MQSQTSRPAQIRPASRKNSIAVAEGRSGGEFAPVSIARRAEHQGPRPEGRRQFRHPANMPERRFADRVRGEDLKLGLAEEDGLHGRQVRSPLDAND